MSLLSGQWHVALALMQQSPQVLSLMAGRSARPQQVRSLPMSLHLNRLTSYAKISDRARTINTKSNCKKQCKSE